MKGEQNIILHGQKSQAVTENKLLEMCHVEVAVTCVPGAPKIFINWRDEAQQKSALFFFGGMASGEERER